MKHTITSKKNYLKSYLENLSSHEALDAIQVGAPFLRLWKMQEEYNNRVKSFRTPLTEEDSQEYWNKQYLLGLVSEIDEVLNETNWKAHRKVDVATNTRNIAFELADLTKFVLSLWQNWGFTPNEMLELTGMKSVIMDLQQKQEFAPPIKDRVILVCDIDGTLADWRRSFIAWAEKKTGTIFKPDRGNSLYLDTDLQLAYDDYHSLKEQFEANGGYGSLIPYLDAVNTVRWLQSRGVYLIVYTARPAKKFKQIYWDTYTWCLDYGINPDELYIGHEPRILTAKKLRKENDVFLFEDDPSLISRAGASGLRVYARLTPYNSYLQHRYESVKFVTGYRENYDYFTV